MKGDGKTTTNFCIGLIAKQIDLILFFYRLAIVYVYIICLLLYLVIISTDLGWNTAFFYIYIVHMEHAVCRLFFLCMPEATFGIFVFTLSI